MFAALALSFAYVPAPTFAKPPRPVSSPAPASLAASTDPLSYVQRGTSAKGDFVRALSLFRNGRAVLVSAEADTFPATVQTGTWKRGTRADRLSISLTRQNDAPYRETILLTGTPVKGGMLSAIGDASDQYGAYGLSFAPRISNNAAVAYDEKRKRATITATGVHPTALDGVENAQITIDGYDVIYWKNEAARGTVPEGGSLYYFNTLTGKSRRVAAFAASITKVGETRLASGIPALVVSYRNTATGETGVAAVDPHRERTTKQWRVDRP